MTTTRTPPWPLHHDEGSVLAPTTSPDHRLDAATHRCHRQGEGEAAHMPRSLHQDPNDPETHARTDTRMHAHKHTCAHTRTDVYTPRPQTHTQTYTEPSQREAPLPVPLTDELCDVLCDVHLEGLLWGHHRTAGQRKLPGRLRARRCKGATATAAAAATTTGSQPGVARLMPMHTTSPTKPPPPSRVCGHGHCLTVAGSRQVPACHFASPRGDSQISVGGASWPCSLAAGLPAPRHLT